MRGLSTVVIGKRQMDYCLVATQNLFGVHIMRKGRLKNHITIRTFNATIHTEDMPNCDVGECLSALRDSCLETVVREHVVVWNMGIIPVTTSPLE